MAVFRTGAKPGQGGFALGLLLGVIVASTVTTFMMGSVMRQQAPPTRVAGVTAEPAKVALPTRIPRILHQIYLSGEEALLNSTTDPSSPIRYEWGLGCRLVYGNWEHMFWTEETAQAFLKTHYEWFIPIYNKYPEIVNKGDALRYFIMHHYGGLYVDLDVECIHPGLELMSDYAVVLQGTIQYEDTTNAIIASAAGHPMWTAAIKFVKERHTNGDPIFATGPFIIRDSLIALGLVANRTGIDEWQSGFRGTHTHNGTTIRVYEIGEWFTPCWFNRKECHIDMAMKRAAGLVSKRLAGYHRYASSWHLQGKGRGDHSVLALEDVKRLIC